MEARESQRSPEENEPPAPEDLVQPEHPDNAPIPAPAKPVETPRATARRTFLLDVGKRAIYVAPVIAALTASQAQAAASPSCIPSGAACETDSDCCDNTCTMMMC